MTPISRARVYGTLVLVVAGPVIAQTSVAETVDEKIEQLEQTLVDQRARLAEQENKLDAQADVISEQKQEFEDQRLGLERLRHEVLMESRGTGPEGSGQAQGQPAKAASQPQRKPVGQAPAKTAQAKPDVGALADIGGVLTPRGRLVIEPSLQYSHSSVNRVTFRGIEILSSLGIGVLEAVDADRDAVIASVTGRLGVTNRLEFELKLPYVWRRDKETAAIPQLDNSELSSSLDNQDFGDIELAAHYQLNRGQDGWPFFIANGRLKLTNADGPFDIERDADGLGQELATGSGFYSFEPSITALYPSAPAVFFGNVGYLVNIKDDIDTAIGFGESVQNIGTVDPGDAFRISFGMAYSINERASFTLGFKNDWIQATETEINGTKTRSTRLNIGSMLLGYSFQATPKVGLNLNLEFGISDDAPDMNITFRMPFATEALWQ